jgi:hypothetical protein
VDCFGQLPFGGIAFFAKSSVATLSFMQPVPQRFDFGSVLSQ